MRGIGQEEDGRSINRMGRGGGGAVWIGPVLSFLRMFRVSELFVEVREDI